MRSTRSYETISNNSSTTINDSAISLSEETSEFSIKNSTASNLSEADSLLTSQIYPVKITKHRRSTTTSNKSSSLSIKSTTSNVTTTETTTTTKKPRNRKKQKKIYLCNVCDKKFLGSSDLRRHLLVHSGEKPYKCDFCDKSYRQAICLKNHTASVHVIDPQYVCDFCQKKFTIKERLRLHMRIHSGEKPYKCPVCSKTFARGGQLRQHKVTHSTNVNKCTTCNAIFASPDNLRTHMKTHLKKEHTCKVCDKSFTRLDILRNHISCTHANIKSFFCNICNKSLKGHLKQHLKTHENYRPYSCDVCDAQFSQKSNFKVHLNMHSGERPYKCKVCWQAFAHSSVLKLHIRKHTGEKPFPCCLCKDGTAFSQLAHLKTHMRTIHGKTKPYMCEGCNEFFKIKIDLENHTEKCEQYINLNFKQQNDNNRIVMENNLTKLRLLVAVLLKKISTEERLKQLGFEKRLIDNVIVTALKLAGRKCYEYDNKITELHRLKMNIEEFLEWTVPSTFLNTMKQKKLSIEDTLESIASAYSQGS